jgi:hypothetical protein
MITLSVCGHTHPEDGINQMWPMREDLSYTNATLMTASIGRIPTGGSVPLVAREICGVGSTEMNREWDRLMTWLDTGVDPVDPAAV